VADNVTITGRCTIMTGLSEAGIVLLFGRLAAIQGPVGEVVLRGQSVE